MTDLAIMSSSSVWMTRTLPQPPSREISGAFLASRFESSSMPRNSSPSQIRFRITGAFSPMPPAKTTVSTPPSARPGSRSRVR